MKLRIASLIIIAMTTIAVPASAAAHHQKQGPLVSLLRQYGPMVRCIMWAESRSTPSHLNLRDNRTDGGSSGIFQFQDSTFRAHSPWPIHVWQASPYQQEVTFVRTVRVNGFGQWTRFDGC